MGKHVLNEMYSAIYCKGYFHQYILCMYIVISCIYLYIFFFISFSIVYKNHLLLCFSFNKG